MCIFLLTNKFDKRKENDLSCICFSLFALDILSSHISLMFVFLYIQVCVIFYTLDKWICVCAINSVPDAHIRTYKHKYICLFVRRWCVSNSNRIYIFFSQLVELSVRINVYLSVYARFYSDIIFVCFFFLMYFDDLIYPSKWICILFYTVQVYRREGWWWTNSEIENSYEFEE